MMKVFKKILSLFICFILGIFIFSGCTYKSYELVGIVKEGDSVITPLAKVDEETLSYLNSSYNCYATIRLKQNGEFIMAYSLTDNGLTVSYSQTGRFVLKEKEETIIFYTPKSDGEERANTQQYSNNTIIFYDGTYFLAFK